MHDYDFAKNFRDCIGNEFHEFIKQMIHLIFVHNPLLIFKMQIFIVKTRMIRLAATEVRQKCS